MTVVTAFRARSAAECAGCLQPSDGRYEWEGHPLCGNCHPAPEAPWKALSARDEADLRKRLDRKAELVRPAVEELLGIPYGALGPPRLTHGLDAWEREIDRQNRLVDLGLQRRGRSSSGESCTLGWCRFSDGRFGWCGNNNGIPGGTWPSPDDYEKAWQAGRQTTAWRAWNDRAARRRGNSSNDLYSDIVGDDDLTDLLRGII